MLVIVGLWGNHSNQPLFDKSFEPTLNKSHDLWLSFLFGNHNYDQTTTPTTVMTMIDSMPGGFFLYALLIFVLTTTITSIQRP